MLPTDSSKRFLLQQQLIHHRVAQQLAKSRMQLQAPSPMTVSAAIAAASPLAQFRHPQGLSRETVTSLQAPQDSHSSSSNILGALLAAENERRLKRRLSEIQQLQQQQRNQQHFLLQERFERSSAAKRVSLPHSSTTATDRTSIADLVLPTVPARTASAPTRADPPADLAGKASTHLKEAPAAEVSKEDPEKVTVKKTAEGTKGEVPEGAGASSGKPSQSGGVSRKDARWREMYRELVEFKKEHGSCIVPRGFSENPRLASWVAEQRKQYKLMKDLRQSSITPDRVNLLNEIDFAWNAQEAAWTKHMSDLKEFRKTHGHCHVPLNDPNFPKLGLWVKEQRRHYTLMKQGKQSHMTEARCEELDSVGFCWDTHEATWLERLNELRAYKGENGHCIVPTNFPQNPKLGTWIHHQRRQYKKYKDGKPCHITAERIRALDSLGFVWHPRDKHSCLSAEGKESTQETDLTDLDLRPRKRQRQSAD